MKPNKQAKNNSGGFTLIELLVVVAIIALLSSVVLTSMRESRVKAQNAERNEMALQYINALELYRTSSGANKYPDVGAYSYLSAVCLGIGWEGGDCMDVFGLMEENSDLQAALDPYLSGVPKNDEPLITTDDMSGTIYFCEDSTCANYRLWWFLEGEDDKVSCIRQIEPIDSGSLSRCEYFSSNSY